MISREMAENLLFLARTCFFIELEVLMQHPIGDFLFGYNKFFVKSIVFHRLR